MERDMEANFEQARDSLYKLNPVISLDQKVCFQARRKFTYDLRLATRSACVRASLTHGHSTEQTKLAISFSLRTFQLIIYSDRRS